MQCTALEFTIPFHFDRQTVLSQLAQELQRFEKKNIFLNQFSVGIYC